MLLAFVMLVLCSPLTAQNKLPYQIYSNKGKKVTYSDMVASASRHQVVLFGEYHDNSIIHWLQMELLQDLAKGNKIVVGAEMLEADNQQILDQYLAGEVSQKGLDTLARLWPNYKTDYKPIVDFAKAHKLKVIATNVPRRYASSVYKGGFEALDRLSPQEQGWMAPLPVYFDKNLPGYVKMVAEMGGHGGDNLPKAQALKDATMAHFITQNLTSNAIFYHLNGTYHSDYYDGLYFYLKNAQPKLKVMTIGTATADDVAKFASEHLNKADFIIVTDNDITKTH